MMHRNWIAIEVMEEYGQQAKLRFEAEEIQFKNKG
jgi:hypothetical protein